MYTLSYLALLVTAWLALALMYTGVGLLFRRAMGAGELALRDLLRLPVLGWCLTLPLLTIWHFFRPIDVLPLVVIAALGAFGIAWHGPVLRRLAARAVRHRLGFLAVLIAAGFALANHTAVQHTMYDSGFYHLSAISWIQSYSVIPGLGNLSKMLGFNDSYFLYVALLDRGPFAFKVHHLAGAFLIYMLLCRSLAGCWWVLSGAEKIQSHHVLDGLILVYIFVLTMGPNGASHSPDLAVYILGFVLGSEVLRILESSEKERLDAADDNRERGNDLLIQFYGIFAIAAVGVTVKLNFLVFAAVACLLAMISVSRVIGFSAVLRGRLPGLIAGCLLIVVVPWCLRGLFLTGSIAYPSSVLVFPVDWRVPAEVAREYVHEIRAWARQPYADPDVVMADWRWLWVWINEIIRAPYEVVIPIALGVLGSPLLAWATRTRLSAIDFRAAFLVLPLAALLFWFLAAPDPRFAGANFWLLGAGAFALVLVHLDRKAVSAVLIVFVLISMTMNFNLVAFVLRWKRDMGPERFGELKTMTTRSGLVVNVPVEGYQVWRAPLPATPYFNPDLRLRVPGDLSRGFTVLPTEGRRMRDETLRMKDEG